VSKSKAVPTPKLMNEYDGRVQSFINTVRNVKGPIRCLFQRVSVGDDDLVEYRVVEVNSTGEYIRIVGSGYKDSYDWRRMDDLILLDILGPDPMKEADDRQEG
jgi:hypothetical protein